MKIGDYVRTNKGIARIIGKNDDVRYAYPDAWETDTYLEIVDDTEYLYDEEIIKSSPNIIDLIEIGDYVNGEQIVDIRNYDNINNEKLLYYYIPSDYGEDCFRNKDIKSIVTKEQFESMKYKI